MTPISGCHVYSFVGRLDKQNAGGRIDFLKKIDLSRVKFKKPAPFGTLSNLERLIG
ncbi:hypothetical protein GCM10028819_52080 [Spirosoma humi]